jgi:hypothetical protein
MVSIIAAGPPVVKGVFATEADVVGPIFGKGATGDVITAGERAPCRHPRE